jgi:hypothetical protein
VRPSRTQLPGWKLRFRKPNLGGEIVCGGDNNLQFQIKKHNCSFKPKITNFNLKLQLHIKLQFQHKITNGNLKLQFHPNCNFKPNWF